MAARRTGDGDPQPGTLEDNRARALIQMATGSGKTSAAANICERPASMLLDRIRAALRTLVTSLHVVVVADDAHVEERLITVYEPSTERWSDDFRRRR